MTERAVEGRLYRLKSGSEKRWEVRSMSERDWELMKDAELDLALKTAFPSFPPTI